MYDMVCQLSLHARLAEPMKSMGYTLARWLHISLCTERKTRPMMAGGTNPGSLPADRRLFNNSEYSRIAHAKRHSV
jgi:hypothetical protein